MGRIRIRSSLRTLGRRGGATMAEAGTQNEVTAYGEPALKRVMGPGLLLLFVVGDILGTGVYALTGRVAAEAGGAVWLPVVGAVVVAVRVRGRGGGARRLQLSGAGRQVPAGGRGGALHAQGVRHPLPDVPGHL